jgi:alpha-tubulin suppressor-like RCC1 family protein
MRTTLALALLGLLVPVSSSVAASPAGEQWGRAGSPTDTSHGPQYDAPFAVTGIPNPVVQVSATNSDDYALDDTGTVWAWGADQLGELGTGQTYSQPFTSTPVQVVFPEGVSIASLGDTMPDATGLAIDTDGRVWGWGYNSSEELCRKTRSIAAPVMLPFPDVTLTSGAGDHALYESGGILYACGNNGNGDLGDGSTASPGAAPVRVTGLGSQTIVALVSSYRDSGALMSTGAYDDWGANALGQLGDGSKQDSDTPVQVGFSSPVSQVAQGGADASGGQSIAILADGSVWSWGSNTYGQLGDGTTASTLNPVAVDVPDGVTFTSVASGGAAEYAVDADGYGWAWGKNRCGQLGIGEADTKVHDAPLALGVTFSQISSTASNVYGR